MIGIIDYGVGNLFSLRSSFEAIGQDAFVSGDPESLSRADRLVLPGVGAFGDAADKLRERGLFDVLRDLAAAGKPLMGICLGMQLLFEKGFEYGEHEGLGLIKGEVRPIAEVIPCDLKIPHIGWNALHFTGEKSPIFRYLEEGDFVYFVHSFYGKNEGDRYEIISNILGEVPPPAPIVKEGNADEIIRSPKNGVKSEMYLERYKGESLISRKRMRVDEYRPIQGIIAKKVAQATNKIPFSACLF